MNMSMFKNVDFMMKILACGVLPAAFLITGIVLTASDDKDEGGEIWLTLGALFLIYLTFNCLLRKYSLNDDGEMVGNKVACAFFAFFLPVLTLAIYAGVQDDKLRILYATLLIFYILYASYTSVCYKFIPKVRFPRFN